MGNGSKNTAPVFPKCFPCVKPRLATSIRIFSENKSLPRSSWRQKTLTEVLTWGPQRYKWLPNIFWENISRSSFAAASRIFSENKSLPVITHGYQWLIVLLTFVFPSEFNFMSRSSASRICGPLDKTQLAKVKEFRCCVDLWTTEASLNSIRNLTQANAQSCATYAEAHTKMVVNNSVKVLDLTQVKAQTCATYVKLYTKTFVEDGIPVISSDT